jgi:hypothetical protein
LLQVQRGTLWRIGGITELLLHHIKQCAPLQACWCTASSTVSGSHFYHQRVFFSWQGVIKCNTSFQWHSTFRGTPPPPRTWWGEN